jgi:hypothetical protein
MMAAVMLVLTATTVTALAASNYENPAEVVAGLTDRTVESVVAEKVATGNTYGSIAKEADVLDAFKDEVLKIKENRLAEKVTEGTMTQEQADTILKALEANQAECDGTGSSKIGKLYGAGFGNGSGAGTGCGMGNGNGQGRGAGNGLRDGSCMNQ